MVRNSRKTYANATSHEPSTASDVKQALHDFARSSDNASKWLLQLLRVPKAQRANPDHIRETLDTIVDNIMEVVPGSSMTFSRHSLATCALFHRFIPAPQCRKGPTLLGPAFRLFSNFEGARGKQYLPHECCGEDVELAANRMPAYWERMRANANNNDAQRSAELNSLAMPSPPVMCWICGEGFLDNTSFCKHCDKEHGDYAEYRKRLFYRAQKDGFKPLLPWVKRHILQSATFHTTS
jgi:hypothetical protein